MGKLYQKFHEESDNVLEFMLKIFRFTMQLFAETNPKYFEEMQRYPSLQEEFLKSRQDHAHHSTHPPSAIGALRLRSSAPVLIR